MDTERKSELRKNYCSFDRYGEMSRSQATDDITECLDEIDRLQTENAELKQKLIEGDNK